MFKYICTWNTARADSPTITKSSFLAFACNSTISLQAFCMVITDSSSNWSIVVSTDLGLCWGNIGRQIFNMDCIDWWPELLKTTSGKKNIILKIEPIRFLPIGSLLIGSLPIGSSPIGSSPIGSLLIGSLPIGSLPIGSLTIGSCAYALQNRRETSKDTNIVWPKEILTFILLINRNVSCLSL